MVEKELTCNKCGAVVFWNENYWDLINNGDIKAKEKIQYISKFKDIYGNEHICYKKIIFEKKQKILKEATLENKQLQDIIKEIINKNVVDKEEAITFNQLLNKLPKFLFLLEFYSPEIKKYVYSIKDYVRIYLEIEEYGIYNKKIYKYYQIKKLKLKQKTLF